MNIRFLGIWNPYMGVVVALALAVLAFHLHRGASPVRGPLALLLPCLRALAVFLVALIPIGPTLRHRVVIGELTRLLVVLDASRSMATADAPHLAHGTAATRWDRARALLFGRGRDGFLARMAGEFDARLLLLDQGHATAQWDCWSDTRPPAFLHRAPAGRSTDLALDPEALAGADTAGRSTVLVLLSDGRHNAGPSPLAAGAALAARSIPLFTVGFGDDTPRADLAVAAIDAPETLFLEDRLSGSVTLIDRMPPGRVFRLRLLHEGATVWNRELQTEGNGRRDIPFDLPVEELVARLRAQGRAGDERVLLPLHLAAELEPVEGEAERANNRREIDLRVLRQKRRFLILDARPRWETRFLRNLFERDPLWEVVTLLGEAEPSAPEWPRGDGPGKFPASRESLFGFDLVAIGDLPAACLERGEQEWIRDFVAQRGGGLLLIDGRDLHLRGFAAAPLDPLLPVRWTAAAPGAEPASLCVTAAGRASGALRLDPDPGRDAKLWASLKPPRWSPQVEPAPGAEVFLEARRAGTQILPLLVARRYGAGAVLYCAHDQSWRWREEDDGDAHARFWGQIVDWLMPPLYALRSERLWLDAGATVYRPGDTALLRARLPPSSSAPDALEASIFRDGRETARVRLDPEPRGPGFFAGRTPPLELGHYEVGLRHARGVEGLEDARVGFLVKPPPDHEMDELGLDAQLLEAMAEAAGGRFLREGEFDRLDDLLRPLRRGRVEERETLLWQSWWWFVPIVALLAVEWALRKRAGLV